jgi:thioredoxin-dependent peroxiredoxin
MRPLLFLALIAALSAPVHAALHEGDPAPYFTAPAVLAGKAFTFSLKGALQKGPVVVYFYPSAYTGGCNIQAHTFAVNSDKFAAAGATIIGVSLDSLKRLEAFSADPDYCAGRFPTASDAGGMIARSFDLMVRAGRPGQKDSRNEEIGHDFTERTTFVILPDGRVYRTIGGVAPEKNVEEALEVVQQLHKP